MRGMLAVAPNGESIVLEVSTTDEERARGLMGRSEVSRGTGMYFRFPAPGYHSFWMKNCLTALDIVWLDGRGTVVHVGEGIPPCDADPCPSYEPSALSSQVIEVGAGEARRLGMVTGARVVLQPIDGRAP